jgi:hypothetical protein
MDRVVILATAGGNSFGQVMPEPGLATPPSGASIRRYGPESALAFPPPEPANALKAVFLAGRATKPQDRTADGANFSFMT